MQQPTNSLSRWHAACYAIDVSSSKPIILANKQAIDNVSHARGTIEVVNMSQVQALSRTVTGLNVDGVYNKKEAGVLLSFLCGRITAEAGLVPASAAQALVFLRIASTSQTHGPS